MIGWYGPTENSTRYALAKEQWSELATIENLKDVLSKNSQKFSAILLSEDSYAEAFQYLTYVANNLMFTEFVDGFCFENEKWVAQNSYLDSFQKKFSTLARFIDTGQGILVVGDYPESRAALMALFRIGFRDFYILDEGHQIDHWLHRVAPTLIGITVKSLNVRELVNLSGETSVIVHGVSLKDQVLSEWELSYLNFLSRPGLIIDYLDQGFLTQVVRETQDEELNLIDRTTIEKVSLDWWKIKLKA